MSRKNKKKTMIVSFIDELLIVIILDISDISQCWNNVFHEPPPPLPIDSNNIIHENEVQYTFFIKTISHQVVTSGGGSGLSC